MLHKLCWCLCCSDSCGQIFYTFREKFLCGRVDKVTNYVPDWVQNTQNSLPKLNTWVFYTCNFMAEIFQPWPLSYLNEKAGYTLLKSASVVFLILEKYFEFHLVSHIYHLAKRPSCLKEDALDCCQIMISLEKTLVWKKLLKSAWLFPQKSVGTLVLSVHS